MEEKISSKIIPPRDFPSEVSKWMKINASPKMTLKLTKVCKYFRYKDGLPYLAFLVVLKDIFLRQIELLPEKLNKRVSSRKPVIAIFGNFSFICINSGNQNGYEFIDRWNGLRGKDLFVSFDEAKPKFGSDATAVYSTTPSFVVFDIHNILSMPPDNIKKSKHWGFEIIQNANEPVLIEVDCFGGTKKRIPPFILMALIIKFHVAAIEAETGEMPKELVFCIHYPRYNYEQKERIYEGISNACVRLGIYATLI